MAQRTPMLLPQRDGAGGIAFFNDDGCRVALVGVPSVVAGWAFLHDMPTYERADGSGAGWVVASSVAPEDLPIDPGHGGWYRLSAKELAMLLRA